MSNLVEDDLPKKRGRPKNASGLILKNSPESDLKKKTGRRKKTEIINLPSTMMMENQLIETSYLVILDIKYSDLESTYECEKFAPVGVSTGGHSMLNSSNVHSNQSDTHLPVDTRLICDSLINSFAKLIAAKNALYDNCPTLKTIHDNKLIKPDSATVNFSASYENKDQNENIKVLPIFELNGNNWPHLSSYSCWNCDCQFESVPIGIPETITDNQFCCSGNFCSFPCAARYIVDNDNSIYRLEKIAMLNHLYQKAYDLNTSCFVPIANPRQTLQKYGGCLSYAEYHQKTANEINFYKLPIVPLFYFMTKDGST